MTLENKALGEVNVSVQINGDRKIVLLLKPKQWALLKNSDVLEVEKEGFSVQILLSKSNYAKPMVGTARVIVNEDRIPSMSYTEKVASFPGEDGPLGAPVFVIHAGALKDVIIQY